MQLRTIIQLCTVIGLVSAAVGIQATSVPDGSAGPFFVSLGRGRVRFATGERASAIQRAVASLESQDRLAAVGSGGAWVRTSPLEQGRQFPSRDPTTNRSTYGFYLHTYNKPRANIHLLRTLRKTYPKEPVYIMSDGGMGFEGICREIGNCMFQWRPPANDRWNPWPFFNRFRDAARWLDSKYIVMLEPDNTVEDHIFAEPKEDAGGVRDTNPAFGPRIRGYVEELGRKASGDPSFALKWWRFGLCGGAYFRTAAVLDAFDPTTIDWHQLRALHSHAIWSSDQAMPMALAAHGYSYYPWDEVSQLRTENWYGRPEHVAFEHHGRDEGEGKYFKKPISQADMAAELYTNPPPNLEKVRCQGCVWTDDADCPQEGCPTTGDDSGPPWGKHWSLRDNGKQDEIKGNDKKQKPKQSHF